MTLQRERDFQSSDSAQPFEPLSKADLELVQSHLWAASEELFPVSEWIGKTAQQDFYFRELLDRLLLNFGQSQAPVTGGNLAEIWALTRSATPKWRARPEAKKRRAAYGRTSMKTLVHEWNRAVRSRPRTYRKRGVIEIGLRIPDGDGEDVVLFATISNFKLVDGDFFSIDIRELTAETRLPTPSIGDSDSEEERDRLLRRASRIVRDVEKKYLEKLQDAPLEAVATEVEALERDKQRRDYRRLAASIVVVLGAGMAAYKILSVNHFVPVFDVSKGHRHEVSNVISDHKGHVALAEDGKAASPWANGIVDERGNGAVPLPKKPGWVQLSTDEIKLRSKIPERWKQDDSAVLPAEGTCFQTQSGDGNGAIVGCNLLYDLRSIDPKLSASDVTVAVNFGETPAAMTLYRPNDVVCVNSDCSRIRLWMMHGYERNGQYEIDLVILQDKGGLKNGTPFDGVPLARITIQSGDLAAVEPMGGDHFEIATLPDGLKLRPILPAR